MKTPEQVLGDMQRRLQATWHLEVTQQCEAGRAEQSDWPRSFPLGTVPRTALEKDFERFQKAAFVWRDWAAAHGLTLSDAPRLVHGTTQRIPTHVTVPSIDVACELCGRTWVDRLTRGRARTAELRHRFPHTLDLPRVVRDIDGYTEVDVDLLYATAEWFRQNSAAGLTPRQVPIPGLHANGLTLTMRPLPPLPDYQRSIFSRDIQRACTSPISIPATAPKGAAGKTALLLATR